MLCPKCSMTLFTGKADGVPVRVCLNGHTIPIEGSQTPVQAKKRTEAGEVTQAIAKPQDAFLALGRMTKGKKNKTEQAYEDEILIPLHRSCEVLWYAFEALTFKVGRDCRYTPDWIVQVRDRTLMCVDTKGSYVRDDALVKIRACAQAYPMFQWRFVKRVKGGWDIQEF